MVSPPLLIFDSGIGGFSILKALKPYSASYLYFADQANFPYGEKSEAWIRARLYQLAVDFAKYDPVGVVVACNSATVSAIDILRSKLTCPIFGVEPVTKMLKHHRHPVVWGTAVTTHSAVAQSLKQSHAENVRYYTPAGLAAAIEADDQAQIKRLLALVKTELGEVDAIGLSCTHYPLIKKQIETLFAPVPVYDPSQAVAAHVATTLSLPLASDGPSEFRVSYLSTGSVLRLHQLAQHYGL